MFQRMQLDRGTLKQTLGSIGVVYIIERTIWCVFHLATHRGLSTLGASYVILPSLDVLLNTSVSHHYVPRNPDPSYAAFSWMVFRTHPYRFTDFFPSPTLTILALYFDPDVDSLQNSPSVVLTNERGTYWS